MNFKKYDDYGVLNIAQGGWDQVGGYVVRMTPGSGIYYTARISQIDYVPIGHPDKIIVSGIANKAIEVSVLTLRNDNYIIAELGWRDNGSEFTLGTYDKLAIGFRYQDNTNITPNDVNDKKVYNWADTPHYIHNTSTDTITTLPAVLYPTGTTATVGLKGQAVQSGTPTPTTPIQPQECGELEENVAIIDNQSDTINNSYYKDIRLTDVLKAGTYTVSYSFNSRTGAAYTSSIGRGNSSAYLGDIVDIFVQNTPAKIVRTITLTKDECVWARFLRSVTPSTFSYNVSNIRIEEGNVSYGYKIPISSANTTTPIYLGEVETTRRIKKYEFTGQENWSYTSTGRVYMTMTSQMRFINPICTHYKGVVVTGYAALNDGEITVSINNQLAVYDTARPTAEDFKAYLAQQYAAGTPMTIWYVLKTEETGIVNEPLRKIGDYADSVSGITIPTIAGANTISVDTQVQPSEVSVNYKGWHPVQSVHEAENGQWD